MRTISRRVFQVLHPAGILSRLATVGSVSTAAVYTVIKAYAVYLRPAGCHKLHLLMKTGSRCRLSKCTSNLCINVTSQQFRIVSVSMFNGAAFITQCVAQSSGCHTHKEHLQNMACRASWRKLKSMAHTIIVTSCSAYTPIDSAKWPRSFHELSALDAPGAVFSMVRRTHQG